jgi:hypothetical protein
MATWQLIVSICAGIITVITILEKLGITGGIKKIEREFKELQKQGVHLVEININQQKFSELQKDQNNALLAILRNELFQSFRNNRELKVWTDDECSVQTKMHLAYRALHGNGEEEIWWNKKLQWTIVSAEKYRELLDAKDCAQIQRTINDNTLE